jgi:xanthine dehydrogenase accessory factor
MSKLWTTPVFPLVAVKGAGDLATGVIHRLVRSGFPVLATELPQPTVLRRTVAFAEAVALGEVTVEGVTARLTSSIADALALIAAGRVPILVAPTGDYLHTLQPVALIDATLAKQNTGLSTHTAPIVIALGPGFEAGVDAHAVIETNRGHNLGRVYFQGYAEPNTGIPGTIGGHSEQRLLRAPCAGTLTGIHHIGDTVHTGEIVAIIHPRANTATEHAVSGGDNRRASVVERDGVAQPVIATINGILRGLVCDGLSVSKGMKIGDIDPRAVRDHCYTLSDKSRAVAGGALEALLYLLQQS